MTKVARFNHAYDIAFVVLSDNPEGATFEEWKAGLQARANQSDEELRLAFEADLPFDTFEEES